MSLVGSVTEEVVRLSPRPVLTIRGPAVRIRAVPPPPRTCLSRWISRGTPSVPQSGTRPGDLCRAYGARMHLLHAFEQPVTPEVYAGSEAWQSAFDFSAGRGRASGRRFSAWRTRAGVDVETEIHVREGRAVRW